MFPLLTGAPEVAYHLRPGIVLRRKNSLQVIEGGDLGEGGSVGSECPLLPLPCLFLRQTMTLPLHSPSAEYVGQVPDVKGLLWKKLVALRAPGVGAANFLQGHNCIPNVAVRKVNP